MSVQAQAPVRLAFTAIQKAPVRLTLVATQNQELHRAIKEILPLYNLTFQGFIWNNEHHIFVKGRTSIEILVNGFKIRHRGLLIATATYRQNEDGQIGVYLCDADKVVAHPIKYWIPTTV